jgi:hypothetical protein
MKYVILIYHNPEARRAWEQLPETDRAEGLRAYTELNEELAASGELIVSEALADPELAKSVTMRNGEQVVTDGPFAEVKEQLAGFFLLECESIQRAIEVAGRLPDASDAKVEVRPVLTYSGTEM